MKRFLIITILLTGFFVDRVSAQKASAKADRSRIKQQIVFFENSVTPAQRKDAVAKLKTQGISLLEGNPEKDHLLLMGSSQLIDCKNHHLVCNAFSNIRLLAVDPCVQCVVCCPKGSFAIKPRIPLESERMYLYEVMMKIEAGKNAKVKVDGRMVKPTEIDVSIQKIAKADSVKVRELLNLEKKSLLQTGINLNYGINGVLENTAQKSKAKK